MKAGGYLLSGGLSWNLSEWGPACLSVEAVEFVTADGKKIKASAAEHPSPRNLVRQRLLSERCPDVLALELLLKEMLRFWFEKVL